MGPREKTFPNGRKLRVTVGDITKIRVDAMANAANSALAGGGGVDGAIHDAGGPSIMAELGRIPAAQGGCPTGSAVATGAGKLPAKHVFHAVGPVYRGGKNDEAALLVSCYEACLDLATQHGVETLSFPAISAGTFGYPLEEAAAIAIDTISERLETKPGSVRMVILVLFDARTYRIFERLLLE
jgi:O-acetyl-ADP-ribose deacetylase